MSLLPKSIHRCRRYPTKFNSGRDIPNFGVAYGSDVARVKELVLDAISKLDDTSREPGPRVLFLNMNDFSLDMSARVWVDNYDKQFAKKLEMTELVYNTLNKNGIEIPFPTRTVYMKQSG